MSLFRTTRVLVFAIFCFTSPWVHAQTNLKVAVIDQIAALLDSDAAQALLKEYRSDIESDREQIKALENSIQRLSERLEKDSLVLAQAEVTKIEADIQDKQLDRSVLIKKIKNKNQAAQQQIMNQLGPKLEKVLTELQEQKKFDLIVSRQSLIWAEPSLDITQTVTERLNQAK